MLLQWSLYLAPCTALAARKPALHNLALRCSAVHRPHISSNCLMHYTGHISLSPFIFLLLLGLASTNEWVWPWSTKSVGV